jgi:acetyl esterase/lipase
LVLATTSCEETRVVEHVAYDDRFGDATTMDIHVPNRPGLLPGVLFAHGGSWRAGSKREFSAAASRLARSGYVAATINYRLVPDGVYPRLVQDCLCALSYFRAHALEYSLDPRRVAVMGYSAGGHLVSLMGVASDAPWHIPDCAAGPTYPPAAVISGGAVHDARGADNLWVDDLVGGDPRAMPEVFVRASPITYVGPGKPPFLLINGTGDWVVDISSARAMRTALLAAGNDATLLEITGAGHLLNNTADLSHWSLEELDLTPEAWLAVMDFLARTVGRP